jgi:hypothetical protein
MTFMEVIKMAMLNIVMTIIISGYVNLQFFGGYKYFQYLVLTPDEVHFF